MIARGFRLPAFVGVIVFLAVTAMACGAEPAASPADVIKSAPTPTATMAPETVAGPTPTRAVKSAPTIAPESLGADYPEAQWVPADGSNFTPSRRGVADVSYVVLHAMFGSLDGTVSRFENPTSDVSAHYLVGRNGTSVQMVREQDIAWHAGNWPYNQQSVGIELEDLQQYLNGPWATQAMY